MKMAFVGRIIDGTGKVLFDGVVLIDGEKIEKVGEKVEIPPKAKIIKVNGGTIQKRLRSDKIVFS